MDILIQLLVWLFRTLFGEVEQPPDTTPGQRPVPPSLSHPRRGPYMYGDEPPGQARTLEQILEEVRQAAAQKRGQAAAPPPPQPSRTTSTSFSVTGGFSETAAPVQPQPRATSLPVPGRTPPRRASPVARRAGGVPAPAVAREVEPEAARTAPEELVSLNVAPPSLDGSPAVQPPGPEPMSLTGAQTGAEPLAAIAEVVSPAEAAAELAKRAAATTIDLPSGITGLLNAILQATPEQRRDVARQAIVLREVFGPPRCRRPHRAGYREF